MLTADQEFGHYRILGIIGSGGMGEVYLAQDSRLGRNVAIKILPDEVAHDTERMHRFVQEAKATSSLNHPNIITIHEIGELGGAAFIVTEFIEGDTVAERLKQGPFSVTESLSIAVQIASALTAAHSLGIIHRDIKPANVMVRPDGVVKVLDFGIAKLSEQRVGALDTEAQTRVGSPTVAGAIIGTAGYMSPEQAQGKRIDAGSDIFSFGVLLYEMLSGVQPFQSENAIDAIAKILYQDPAPIHELTPSVPVELERIVQRTLRKERTERYETTDELLKELQGLKSELDFMARSGQMSAKAVSMTQTEVLSSNTANPAEITAEARGAASPTGGRFAKLGRRNPLIYAALSILVLAGFAYIWAWPQQRVDPEAVRLFSMGREALRDGTYFKASKLLQDAIKIDDRFAAAHAGLAESWIELDYHGRAQSEMLKANEIQRKGSTIVLSLFADSDSSYVDAVNSTVLRKFPQAVKAYQRIVHENPNEAGAHLDLGRAYERNEEIDKAIEAYENAIDLNGQYAAAHLKLGVLFRRKNEFQRSAEEFDRAESIYDRTSNDEGIAEVKLQRGISLNTQEKLDDARKQFEQVINNARASKSQVIQAMLQVSSLCSSRMQPECAEEHATNAIRLAEQERMQNLAATGLIDLGNAYFSAGEYSKAEQRFVEALELSRKDEGLHNEARALLALGSMNVQQKKATEAEGYVRQALPFFQEGGYKKWLAQAHLILGRVEQMKGNSGAALEALALVTGSEDSAPPDRAYAEMISGTILTKEEDYPGAFRHFERSYAIYKSLDNAFYTAYSLLYLSDALNDLGRFPEAAAELDAVRKIIETTPAYEATLAPRIELVKARAALKMRSFDQSVKGAKAGAAASPSLAFDSDMIIGMALASSPSGSSRALDACARALDHATQAKDENGINTIKLIQAEAQLNAGKPRDALETVIPAKDFFSARARHDSEWRAWVLAAQAHDKLGETAEARNCAAQALKVLSELEARWGQETYDTYLKRPDKAFYFGELQKLLPPL